MNNKDLLKVFLFQKLMYTVSDSKFYFGQFFSKFEIQMFQSLIKTNNNTINTVNPYLGDFGNVRGRHFWTKIKSHFFGFDDVIPD